MSGIFRAMKYSVMTLVAAALLFAAASPSYAEYRIGPAYGHQSGVHYRCWWRHGHTASW